MIELYGMTSPNVLKLALMLEECGFDYRVHHVDVFAGEQNAPDFLTMNPNGKVPVMVDKGVENGESFSVFESNAGLLYLAEKKGAFLPTEPRARSVALQWLLLQASTVGAAFGQYVHFFRYAPDVTYALRRYESEAARVLGVLDRRLGDSQWLTGDEYGLADIATWPGVRTGNALFPLLVENGCWAALPNLRRWFDAISIRPTAVRAIAAIDALLPQDQSAFARTDDDGFDRFFGRGRYDHALALRSLADRA